MRLNPLPIEVDWKIVTEKQINRDKALNLQWAYSGDALEIETVVPDLEQREKACCAILNLIDANGLLPSTCIAPFEDDFHLPAGSAVSFYKFLIIRGDITPNLNVNIVS